MTRFVKFLFSPRFTPVSVLILAIAGIVAVTGPLWVWIAVDLAFLASLFVELDERSAEGN